MPSQRNRMPASVGLAGVLVAVWVLSWWIGGTAASAFFREDLQRRATLAVNATSHVIGSGLAAPDAGLADVRAVLNDIVADEHVDGIALCRGDGSPVAAGVYSEALLSCADARAAIGTGPARTISRQVANGPRPLHATAVMLPGTADDSVPVVVVMLQSLEPMLARTRVVRASVFSVLTLFSIVAFIWLRRAQHRLTSDWVRGFRRALRGENSSPEYRGILREIRELQLSSIGADGSSPVGHWTRERLKRLLRERLRNEHVIVVANREPYIHERTPEGVRVVNPASGLVSALDPVMRASSGVWIAHGAGSADRESSDADGRVQVPPGEDLYTLRRVWMTDEEEQGFYYGFANEGLWPLCHLAHVRPSFRAEDWKQYGIINRRFANAVSDEASRPDPIVLVHDYHFALAPRYIRELLPAATVITFWHIPWPDAERFGISPWRDELLDGLLGSDIVGFHTQAHCNNFMDAVDAYLEARVDRDDGTVTRGGHTTVIRPYPISIEWPIRALATMPSVAECRAEVLGQLGLPEDTILAVGVDRLDYTKGLVERMLAAEALLERSPDLIGRFVLVQLAAPSRTRISRYRELAIEVDQTASRINARFGSEGYTPVVLLKEHHGQQRILRFFRAANICYVSSLHDGMNLVAKEFAASRDDEQGALVLSQFAGASRELTEALIVNPYDIDRAAMALDTAARMSADEQRARMHALRTQIAEFNVYRWAGRMLADAASIRRRVVPRTASGSRAKRRLKVVG